jgi:Fe-S cluster biogenesis protein NfuA
MASRREKILRVVEEVLGPLIRADGGDLYLVSAQDDAVSLHLTGRCAGCPGNTLATRRFIEPAIQAAAPGTKVTVTWGSLVPADARRVLETVRAPASESPEPRT